MLKVGQQQLHSFIDFVEKACLWLSEEGTINLGTGRKLEKDFKTIMMYMD